VFNTGTADLVRTLPVADLGLASGAAGSESSSLPSWRAREAWSGDDAVIGLKDGLPALDVKLPGHSAQLFRFSPLARNELA
jgi:hypothetical protein